MINIFTTFILLVSIVPGEYDFDSKQATEIRKELKKSSIILYLSGHNGISIRKKNDKGWENNISDQRLKEIIKSLKKKKQISILEEKNYNSKDQLSEKITKIAFQEKIELIIIRRAHSENLIISKVLKNPNKAKP